MKQGQNPQERILRTQKWNGVGAVHTLHFAQQVGVGEHDALWIGRRSGGVEQGSDHIRVDGSHDKAGRTCGKNASQDRLPLAGSAGIRFIALPFARIDERNLDRQGADCLSRGGQVLDVAKQQ